MDRATTEVRTVKRRHIKQKRDPVTKEVLFEFVEELTGPVKYHRQTRLRDWLAGRPPVLRKARGPVVPLGSGTFDSRESRSATGSIDAGLWQLERSSSFQPTVRRRTLSPRLRA